jgi:hypothetical protein
LIVAAPCLLLALGCGNSSGDGTDTGQAGAGGGGFGNAGSPPTTAGNAGSSASAGSTSAGAAGTSSAGAGAGGGSAGGPATGTPVQLLPLAVGNRWTYQVTGGGASCADGPHDATIDGMATEGGEQAFEFLDYCKEAQPAYLRYSGNEVLEYAGEWARSLAEPLQEGYSWMFTGNYQLEWHSVGTVTVAAGTFDNCWQRLVTSMGNAVGNRTYCPGVGPVKSSYTTGEASLVSYSLK